MNQLMPAMPDAGKEPCLTLFKDLPVGWLVMWLMLGSAINLLADANIIVQMDGAGRPASPMLYGIFVEDWSHQVEGGIYGEMIRNRSFDDTKSAKETLVAGFTMNLSDRSSSSSDRALEIPGWLLVNAVSNAAVWGIGDGPDRVGSQCPELAGGTQLGHSPHGADSKRLGGL